MVDLGSTANTKPIEGWKYKTWMAKGPFPITQGHLISDKLVVAIGEGKLHALGLMRICDLVFFVVPSDKVK